MKQFMKVLDQYRHCFEFIEQKLSRTRTGKLKAGIFYGPYIGEFISDPHLVDSMNETEREAWISFVFDVKNFQCNRKAENHALLLAYLTLSETLVGGINIEVCYLHSHLDPYPENLGDTNEEHGTYWTISPRHKDNEGQTSEQMRYSYDGRLLVESAKRACKQISFKNLNKRSFRNGKNNFCFYSFILISNL
ncbi:hypothetical protein AVEN_25583-1 [Araneus ventricosus]|uniref:Uncharacterized protein n=1 Tax=Araneus ventricosus TaxID=182803 RepID=A0A4Y2IKR1_ARAVE|nr:hypothetical protein AVEN_25583-1 [Araneus ventricosus]